MATVIKVGEAGTILKRLSTVDLADHLGEARAVVEKAERRAARIVADAQGQVERLFAERKKAGYEAGHAEGIEVGRTSGYEAAHAEAIEQFRQEHAAVAADMLAAVSGIDALKRDLRIAAERDLLDFSIQIAKRLTFQIGKLHRDAAKENFRRALRLLETKTNLTVRVPAADMAAFRTFASGTLDEIDAAGSLSLMADESLSPGGCIVESERARIDATLDTQIGELVALLLDEASGDD